MKKNKIYIRLLWLNLFIFSFPFMFGQSIPEPIVSSFRTGNTEQLSNYFHDRLQVNLRDQEHICSKAQAKEIMREFFSKSKPVSFNIIFEGGKEDSKFAIGSLKTTNGNYRINIFFKKFDNKYLIHLLRIEKDDERAF